MTPENLATLQRLAAEHPDRRRRNAPDMPAQAEREEVLLWFAGDGRIVRMEEFLTVKEARRAVAA
jgi:hypothetical protein